METDEYTKIDEHLYNLHNRVWSSTNFNFDRFEEYALAVMDYKRSGFDVWEHERFVEEYKIFLALKQEYEP